MKLTLHVPVLMSALLITLGATSFVSPANAELSMPSLAVASGQNEAQDSSAANVAGSWQMSWTDNDGTQKQGTLSIQQDSSKLSGTFTGQRGTFPLSGSIQGNHVSLTVGPPRHQFTFSGDVDGSKMSGTTPQNTAWTASKQ